MKHNMTAYEQQIRAHCKAHRIRIEQLPSGAVRFTGNGVDFTTAAMRDVTLANLAPFWPREDYAPGRAHSLQGAC